MIELIFVLGFLCASMCIGHFIYLVCKYFRDDFKNNNGTRH
jgi:uncharacterized protein YneF (UPF0154 family)